MPKLGDLLLRHLLRPCKPDHHLVRQVPRASSVGRRIANVDVQRPQRLQNVLRELAQGLRYVSRLRHVVLLGAFRRRHAMHTGLG
eukprot:2537380-Prorocentrum_lima.AAC.1